MSLLEKAVALGDIDDKAIIEMAEKRGFVIHKPSPPREPVELDIHRIRGKRVKLGILSDSHWGSKFQQRTALRQHAKLMAREGCTAILVPGDVTDGSPEMHKGFVYELWAHGADQQIEAAVEGFPEVGIPYYLIAGNHDASHFKAAGVDVVKHIAARRDDMHYLGPEVSSKNFGGSVGYLDVGEVRIQLCHPHMGSTRTRSYRLETWIENLSPPKPEIVCMGNFHKMVELLYRNVWGLLVPSYQSQSAWMASKGIESIVGGAIIEFGTMTKGLAPDLSIRWLVQWEPAERDYPGGSTR